MAFAPDPSPMNSLLAHAPGAPCDCVLVMNPWILDDVNSHPEENEVFNTVIPDANGHDTLLTKRGFVPMATFKEMEEALKEKELAFVQLGEGGEGGSTHGVWVAAKAYIDRMFTVKERLTFSAENTTPRVKVYLLEIEDIIAVILNDKFKTTIDEVGRQRISELVKTELLVDAVNRRLSNANDDLVVNEGRFGCVYDDVVAQVNEFVLDRINNIGLNAEPVDGNGEGDENRQAPEDNE